MVRDARVDVYAAVVRGGFHIAGHLVRLRVLAEDRIVVRRPGSFHRAHGHPVDARRQQSGADQPVGDLHGRTVSVLLDHDPEHIGEVFVERPALAAVLQARLVLGDAVRELVTDHVHGHREAVEELPVAVAVDHLTAIPECVVELHSVMDARIELRPPVVDRVAQKDLGEEPPGGFGAVEGLHRRLVGRLQIAAVLQDQLPWQTAFVAGVVDVTLERARRGGRGQAEKAMAAARAQLVRGAHRGGDAATQLRRAVLRHVVQHVGRDDRTRWFGYVAQDVDSFLSRSGVDGRARPLTRPCGFYGTNCGSVIRFTSFLRRQRRHCRRWRCRGRGFAPAARTHLAQALHQRPEHRVARTLRQQPFRLPEEA